MVCIEWQLYFYHLRREAKEGFDEVTTNETTLV
jgi:hypothetical protein